VVHPSGDELNAFPTRVSFYIITKVNNKRIKLQAKYFIIICNFMDNLNRIIINFANYACGVTLYNTIIL
jgi:hypothetical protein